MIQLSDKHKEFARCIGYEVALKSDTEEHHFGINLGLYFPDKLAEDGIIIPAGIKVFLAEKNMIVFMAFSEVELVIPEVKPELSATEALYAFGVWLTTGKESITIGAEHSTPAVVELIEAFRVANNLPQCREGWTDWVTGMPECFFIPDNTFRPDNTKRNSCCLQKAKDDEPIFVLLARDPTAPQTIVDWCAHNIGSQPHEKLMAAVNCAKQMQDWKQKQTK